MHTRALLNNLGVLTVPKQAAIAGAAAAFDSEGSLMHEVDIKQVEAVVAALVSATVSPANN